MFTGQFQPSGFSYTHTYGAAEAQGSAYWEEQRQRWNTLMWATNIGDPQRREYEKLANNARKNRDAAYKMEQASEPASEESADDLTFNEGGGVVKITTVAPKAAEAPRKAASRSAASRRTSRGRKDEGFSNTQIALGIFGVVSLLAVVGIVAQRRSSGE
jgi:hypothetical protein